MRVALVTRNTQQSVDAFLKLIGPEWSSLFDIVLTRCGGTCDQVCGGTWPIGSMVVTLWGGGYSTGRWFRGRMRGMRRFDSHTEERRFSHCPIHTSGSSTSSSRTSGCSYMWPRCAIGCSMTSVR